MNVQLNDSGVPILRQKTFAQKVKTFLLWTVLVILTLAAALLVYLCIAGASEMAALTTLDKKSAHPFYTMTYENFDYSDMVTKELGTNDEVIKYYKNKFFSGVSGIFPGGNENDYVTKGSVVFSARTYSGRYMRARIYNSYDAPILMITAKPENGYKSWNIVDMSDVGLTAGKNIDAWYGNTFQTVSAAYCVSEGINSEFFGASLVSCPVAECDDTSLVNITPFMAIRLMLDRAATVESAVDLLKGYDIDFSSGSYHFFVSDKGGNSAVIEYVDGKMSVTYHAPDVFHQICTNKMEDKNVRPASRDYSNRYEEISYYDKLNKTLTSQYTDGMGIYPAHAQLILNDNSKNIKETNETHFGSSNYGTIYTVLYDSNKMNMTIVIDNDAHNQYFTFDLK